MTAPTEVGPAYTDESSDAGARPSALVTGTNKYSPADRHYTPEPAG